MDDIDCEEVEGTTPVDFLFLLGRGGMMPPVEGAGKSVGLSLASSKAENGSLCSWLFALRVEEFLGLGMGLGPGGFSVPIPGSKSRELDEVGAAVVEKAGVGVRMEEEEEGCTERGVRVAERERVYVCNMHVHVHVEADTSLNLYMYDSSGLVCVHSSQAILEHPRPYH